MTELQDYYLKHKIKLTPLRQQVLAILSKQKQPLTAYAVLDELKKDKPNAQVMSVYRVLDFLLENGLVHRIENLNSFIICSHLSEGHSSQWLICESCGKAEEIDSKDFCKAISQIERQSGFRVKTPTIELLGVCKVCLEKDASLTEK